MLARTEEAVRSGDPLEVTAVDALLTGLIDYAGLYPPARLAMGSAVENYRKYRRGKHANVLGRFIVAIRRIEDLRAAAGKAEDLKLSVIISGSAELGNLAGLMDEGLRIEAVEAKVQSADDVTRIRRGVPDHVETFLEIPVDGTGADLVPVISAAGARAKLRMGGVSASAIPSPEAVMRALDALTRAGVSFKATAGLHHPVRSRHKLTYADDSPAEVTHGFLNLVGAVALLHSGARPAEAERALRGEDQRAWSLTPDFLAWESHRWNANQLGETRKAFLSFGSCSFEEPIHDLEALGWL